MPQLNKAAEQFHQWMENFKESHRKDGHLDDNNKALVDFLNGDKGFLYVKTYEELCKLAVLLKKKGYQTTNPPCEPIDFARAIEHANPKLFGDSKPVIPESVRKQLVAEQFHQWMENFKESHRKHGHLDDNNKALVDFLNGDKGFRYVKTYEELCELAVLLKKKGYQTTNPPCEPIDFARAIEHANPKLFGDSKPVIPESVRKQLAAEQEQLAAEQEQLAAEQEQLAAEQEQHKIANNLFKDVRYQATSRKKNSSAAEQEQKGYQSPSLTHSGYDSD